MFRLAGTPAHLRPIFKLWKVSRLPPQHISVFVHCSEACREQRPFPTVESQPWVWSTASPGTPGSPGSPQSAGLWLLLRGSDAEWLTGKVPEPEQTWVSVAGLIPFPRL